MASALRTSTPCISGELYQSIKGAIRTGSLCLGLMALASVARADSTLMIDTLNLDVKGNSSVTFTFSVATPGIRKDATERLRMRPYRTDDGVYFLYVAFSKTAPTSPPNDINYYLYSQPIAARDKEVFTEYVVVGTPRGGFSDQWSLVKFHLNENGLHHGSMELPIPSASNEPLIAIEPDKRVEAIYLSSPTHRIPFAIKSLRNNFEVDVNSADLTTNNEDYWKWSGSDKRYPVEFDRLTPGPPFVLSNSPLTASVKVEPNVWNALMASAHSLKVDQPTDVLLLTIRHNSSPGGIPRAYPLAINIRFRPPWWSLLLAAGIGSVLGSGLTLFFPATWQGTSAVRTIASAVLLAAVAEILGILMFMSDDSNLVIAGLKLNPTEVLPALGLGILVGLLGLKVLDALRSRYRPDDMRITKFGMQLVWVVLLLVAPCSMAGQAGPLALDRFSTKQPLYLLDESGRIFVSDAKQLDRPARNWATVPSVLKAVDLLATRLWGDREQVFVTAYGLIQADPRPRVIQYSRNGERQCEWLLPEISAGLDVDTERHALYLSGSATGTVYRLNLLRDNCYGPKQLNPVLKIDGVGRLGPLAVDSKRRYAFVADSLKGSIYQIGLEQGDYKQVARSLGQPVALLYDDILGRLYAVDSAGRRVWLIDVNRYPAPSPVVVSRDLAFQDPSSITAASNGGLLVGDRTAKVVFLVDLGGRVATRFPMPN